jgi:hypothetical protein
MGRLMGVSNYGTVLHDLVGLGPRFESRVRDIKSHEFHQSIPDSLMLEIIISVGVMS